MNSEVNKCMKLVPCRKLRFTAPHLCLSTKCMLHLGIRKRTSRCLVSRITEGLSNFQVMALVFEVSVDCG